MWQDLPVAALLDGAARGAELAWQEIIRRYSSLVSSVCNRYGVTGADAEDVAGEVWLRLVANVRSIREAKALPGWLATTTRQECLAVLGHKKRQVPSDHEVTYEIESDAAAPLLARERHNAVCLVLARLSERDQKLLSMLFADPPTPYASISSILSMPIGAIGPTRQRCLARIRSTPEIMAL